MIEIYIAPMAGVTDYTYRSILREFSPSMIYTEMVSVNAMENFNKKTINLLLRLHEGDGVQLFGHDPQIIAQSAKYVEGLGVQNIDINAGCPMKKVVNSRNGAALLENPELIKKILFKTRETLKDTTNLSIKIRCGYKGEQNFLKIGKIAEDVGCHHITIHGRTKEQMYGGVANWDIIKELKENINIPVIGNGDVFTAKDALEKVKYSGVDGVMLARGILGNPWLIRDIREYFEYGEIINPVTQKEKIDMAILHTKRIKEENPDKNFVFELRKHICWYLKGIKNSSYLKDKINHILEYSEIIKLLEEYRENTQ
ncbi:MAG: tRNA dihydrouridine synthase DusB [Fusobacteriaceae bacterium]|jgi:nifR3 family TIM-barrel protein|nr:tRNA dihydrouridine synthase DusB [Fusobacteriaceae bacterium]